MKLAILTAISVLMLATSLSYGDPNTTPIDRSKQTLENISFAYRLHDSFSTDDRYCDGPSSFIIYKDGTWRIRIHRCANMHRTPGDPSDSGWDAVWWLRVDYRDGNHNHIYYGYYFIDREQYKSEKSNVVSEGTDAEFAQNEKEIYFMTDQLRVENVRKMEDIVIRREP